MKLNKVVFGYLFAVIVHCINVSSESDLGMLTRCHDDDAKFADIINVKVGDRLTFTCVNCSCSNDLCWMLDHGHSINYNDFNKSPDYYNISSARHPEYNNSCNNEFQLTVATSAGVPYHRVIHCLMEGSDCRTELICSANTTANYIILIEQDVSDSELSLKTEVGQHGTGTDTSYSPIRCSSNGMDQSIANSSCTCDSLCVSQYIINQKSPFIKTKEVKTLQTNKVHNVTRQINLYYCAVIATLH